MGLHDVDPDRLLGNKGYDGDEIRDDLTERGIEAIIPRDRTARQSSTIAAMRQPPQAIP